MGTDFKVGDLVKLKIFISESDNVDQGDVGVVIKTLLTGYEQRIYVKWQRSEYKGPCRKWWLEHVP